MKRNNASNYDEPYMW